jgi:hypothetical protein
MVATVLRAGHRLGTGPAVAMKLFFVQGELGMAGGAGFPLDDSWIGTRLAQNLVPGHRSSFKPGGPSADWRGPLWRLFLDLRHAVICGVAGAAQVVILPARSRIDIVGG